MRAVRGEWAVSGAHWAPLVAPISTGPAAIRPEDPAGSSRKIQLGCWPAVPDQRLRALGLDRGLRALGSTCPIFYPQNYPPCKQLIHKKNQLPWIKRYPQTCPQLRRLSELVGLCSGLRAPGSGFRVPGSGRVVGLGRGTGGGPRPVLRGIYPGDLPGGFTRETYPGDLPGGSGWI